MNLILVSVAYLRAKPLNAALNILLLALGVALVTVLVLATEQFESRMLRDARGIDLVAGAKGSPMQLVLSSVYHLDVPTGNVPLADAMALAKHPMVKRAIPLGLGDTFKGFRIAGTNHDYVALYGGKLAGGRLWEAPLEAVLGADVARTTGLAVGAEVVGSHGLGEREGGDEHSESPYRVVGVLAPTGSVLDRLVLTSLESVWLVHLHLEKGEDPRAVLDALTDAEKEVTALLIQYATPLAVAGLPRQVNASARLQAASPAFESARLFSMIGVGVDLMRAFALILVIAAGLSIFVALYNALEERRYDLAVMRMMGASRKTLLGLLLAEGLVIAVLGASLGLALGHLFTELLGMALAARKQPAVTGFALLPEELAIFAGAVAVGLVAAIIPAWRAYRRDVAATLAEG